MIQFIIGALLTAIGIGIIYAVRSPEDDKERAPVVTLKHALLSNVVLALIMTGGAMMATAIL